jgi:hypothetical protein
MRFIISVIFIVILGSGVLSSAYGQTCQGLSTGEAHTCILTSGGNVRCYGDNYEGQSVAYSGGDAAGVAAGRAHTCILTSGGNVHCYGDNYEGQSVAYTGGDAAGVAAGEAHTCILTSGGNVYCYGDNHDGQSEDYTGGDAVDVAAGKAHTCILTSGGNVYCYGDNHDGQSEDYTGGNAIGVAAGKAHTCILTSPGNIHCYGDEGIDYNDGDAIGISVAYYHACVLTAGGNVKCHGWDEFGETADYLGGDAVCARLQDSDGDGVEGDSDACPYEDATGFDVDNNGCIDELGGLTEVMEALVKEGIITEELQHILLSSIDRAANSAYKDNVCAAISKLFAFKIEVNARRDIDISQKAADRLIAYADSVIAYLINQLCHANNC